MTLFIAREGVSGILRNPKGRTFLLNYFLKMAFPQGGWLTLANAKQTALFSPHPVCLRKVNLFSMASRLEKRKKDVDPPGPPRQDLVLQPFVSLFELKAGVNSTPLAVKLRGALLCTHFSNGIPELESPPRHFSDCTPLRRFTNVTRLYWTGYTAPPRFRL